MTKTIATLIAGLFATAAFAQTPAPAATTTHAATPAAVKAEAKADAKVDATDAKQAVNADVKEAKADAKAAKADATEAKASAKHAKHAKHKAKHHTAKTEAAKDSKDTTVAAAPAPAVK